MFEWAKEYLKFGAARPPGTVWMMERTYFELRHKYPGKDEYAYLRLAGRGSLTVPITQEFAGASVPFLGQTAYARGFKAHPLPVFILIHPAFLSAVRT